MTTYVLPWPPTVNEHHQRTGRGGIRLSDKARAFRSGAIAAILEQGRVEYTGKVGVVIRLYPPDRRGDTDNRTKPVLDALQHAGVLANDKQVGPHGVIPCEPDKANPRCEVSILSTEAVASALASVS